MKSVGLSFFGLSAKDSAVFERVIEFIAKKGKKFHHSTLESAAIFIVNDDSASIQSAQQHQQSQLIICIGNTDDTSISDYKIKRPLLITRVMRALEQAAEKCQTHLTDNPTVSEITQPIQPAKKPNRPPTKPSTTLQTERGDFHALVVDDSAAIRKQLELELRGSSITADYAVCGEDALQKINKRQYDLIFLDIVMPDIYGYEVCKRLRKKSNYKKTPVIMLSGKTSPLDEVEGILAGATTYLKKPVKHQEFQKTLTRISRWLHDYA